MSLLRSSRCCAALLVAVLLASLPAFSTSLGSSFGYQGRLTDNGAPANGTYDFQFTLFDAPSGGSMVDIPIAAPGVLVSGGLYQVVLTFPASSFQGQARYLAISVGPAGGSQTALTP